MPLTKWPVYDIIKIYILSCQKTVDIECTQVFLHMIDNCAVMIQISPDGLCLFCKLI